MIVEGRIPVANKIEGASITIKDGIIEKIEKCEKRDLPLLLPGFIDIHTHGGKGIDINHISSISELDALSSFYASCGVTSFLASIVTDTEENTNRILEIFSKVDEESINGASFLGIHMEGPFLSEEYKGSMPSSLLMDPNIELFNKYYEKSNGLIKYVTIAPERKGSMEFIEECNKKNIVVSMGHSSSTYETALLAIKKGVKSATHLFNAMKLFHMHEPAISGASLLSDSVWCEIICDGRHLHPSSVALVLKTKGLDKVVAITDSIMASGLPDGRYKLGVNDVVVENGDAKTLNGIRAGSTLTLDKALRNLISFTGLSIEELWPLLSKNQASLFSLSDRGSIEIGKRGDLVILDEKMEVLKTIVRGKVVYEREKK